MLDDFGHEMDSTQSRLDNVMKKLAKVSHMNSGNLPGNTLLIQKLSLGSDWTELCVLGACPSIWSGIGWFLLRSPPVVCDWSVAADPAGRHHPLLHPLTEASHRPKPLIPALWTWSGPVQHVPTVIFACWTLFQRKKSLFSLFLFFYLIFWKYLE